MDEGRFSISPHDLYQRIGTTASPLILDVRRGAAYEADDRIIVGALRCPSDEVAGWAQRQAGSRAVVVYCVHGHEVSQGAAEILRGLGLDAHYLAGGIAGWVDQGLPTRRKDGPT